MVQLKRVYDPVSRTDGTRFLVERLWPRAELRQWFNHDPLKWSRFRTRYFRELDSRPESWRPIVTAAKRGTVTLLYSSHDEKHNNAIALQQYLRSKGRTVSPSRRSVAGLRPQGADR